MGTTALNKNRTVSYRVWVDERQIMIPFDHKNIEQRSYPQQMTLNNSEPLSPDTIEELLLDDGLVTRFTGQRDANNELVYEEDVLTDHKGYWYHIKWNDETQGFEVWAGMHGGSDFYMQKLEDTDFSKLEIISNTYENVKCHNFADAIEFGKTLSNKVLKHGKTIGQSLVEMIQKSQIR